MKHITGTRSTIDPYEEQKNKLKGLIKEEEDKMTDLITTLDVKAESELPQEEQDKNKQEFKDKLAVHKANIKALKDTLKEHRMNKNMSQFFEWHPHKGMNRQMARRFRRMKK